MRSKIVFSDRLWIIELASTRQPPLAELIYPMAKSGWLCLLVVGVLLGTAIHSHAGASTEVIAVIAHKGLAVTVATQDDLRPIFQTKKLKWSDGTVLRPFNLPEENTLRRGFDAAVLGLDPDRAARFWVDRKIRGGERPPQTAPSPAVMLAVVSKTPGAIGYVDMKLADANVRVIAKVVNGVVTKP